REQPKVAMSSSMPLSGWSQRTQIGSPQFRHDQGEDGHDLLYLAARGDAICAWRTKITLEEGSYRLEGKVKTKDVRAPSNEPKSGAGLRASGGGPATEIAGTQDWQKFSYPFSVDEEHKEIWMNCELRTSGGEAWFDTSSLRVVRVR